ncbi:hypothetical protein [Rhodanobacter hydrolyticus]|uniref:Uncharacterized protein n=1 Tax=Rhodanobacter hydrolyticus TaxID=2250595 RepID=A0ABW8J1T7_9GAMM
MTGVQTDELATAKRRMRSGEIDGRPPPAQHTASKLTQFAKGFVLTDFPETDDTPVISG